MENKETFDKVLFLDIDGVLNSSKFFDSLNDEEASWKEIDEEAVKILQRIKEETDCKIVMTSSWRNGWNELRRYKMYRYARKVMKDHGFIFDKWYSLLPGYDYGGRAEAIAEFIYDNEVKNYVILDDQDMLAPYLILTNGAVGLTEEDADKAIAILNKE